MPDICVVIPCYNEEKRLNVPAVSAFLSEQPKLMLVFVDDGSRDGIGVMLEELVKRFPWQIRVVTLERNGGKAEAVRAGMAAAVESEAPLVGYWDADFSTPLRLIPVMAELFEGKPRLEIVCGCRLQRLGADIRRSVFRHLVGRCFATLASLFLRLPVYDTQCGAKLLRVRTAKILFREPLVTRWIFDVELFSRFIQYFGRRAALRRIYEYPLPEWRDVSGSTLTVWCAPRILLEFWRIAADTRRRLRDK